MDASAGVDRLVATRGRTRTALEDVELAAMMMLGSGRAFGTRGQAA